MATSKIALIAAPPLLLASTHLCFQGFVALWGPRLGYFAGFLFYWLGWCLLFPLWILGRRGLGGLFRRPQPPFGRPAWLGALFLLLPLALGYGYAFPRALPRADWIILLSSAGIALVNGVLEEVLWRGTYVRVFPDSWWWGYAYPALGFGVWHLAPQSVFPNTAPGGNLSLVAVAVVVGLLWGWVVKRSGSIRWATLSHILFDFSGLGGRIYF